MIKKRVFERFSVIFQQIMLVVLGLILFGTAQAATINGVINVTITLTDSCVINGSIPVAGATWGNLDFGSHPTLFTSANAQVFGQGSTPITVQCEAATPPTLQIIAGVNDSHGGTHKHSMVNGPDYVPYDIYTNPGLTTVIDNGTPFFTSANNGTVETVNIYGQAFGAVGLSPGTYNDTLTVQLTY